jgi:hypothetical protein
MRAELVGSVDGFRKAVAWGVNLTNILRVVDRCQSAPYFIHLIVMR